ncbi:sulfite exporter TauE/SafE family protein [Desulfobulbus oligotrophicus]|uniref:Probable membrane transporter protein n=1 Tax=Desulfobulbus oligotrophicus TaxID=1909699 RepID=A0A7T6ARH1_9BACT|nr:sulfite exporter TauE/SafE family protein [Desulfobulbus oligotrophicus]MDY0389818.1 sulfite exporter TauE/SafE family protein [Desulfobulbus oligotrophicus]QQG66543.1 sulfite exporter TauE/SafE family protein [Desulfobulbus oligotrophicus]
MKKKTGIMPWLVAAMVMFAGVNVACGVEDTSQASGQSAVLDAPTITIDKAQINNGGTIKVSGQVPAGKPVYLEVYAADHMVRANRFDADPDKETGVRPYKFYITSEMPAYYKIFVSKDLQAKIDEEAKKKNKWSYSELLKSLGAEGAYSVPAKAKIDSYQSTLMASIIGSRGDLLPALDAKENNKRSMQLVKARFRKIDNVFAAVIDLKPDGSYTADINVRKGLAPGQYKIVAVADKNAKSEAVTFENKIDFPNVYLGNAGTSLNIFYPFFLTLVVAIFGVLMGAGGGFIMNPLLLTLFPALPHTIVAGTVTPTVLFSQGSGIYNYSKIKFINWKLGCSIGAAMLLGGFIGPKLTEMITLDQFKFAFGWILIVLAVLMFWQTTPGYLAKNKKEQAILKEFKKRAEEAAQGKK